MTKKKLNTLNKNLLNKKGIKVLKEPAQANFAVLGEDFKILVQVEDQVKIGSVLAKSENGKQILSTINGKVTEIEEHAQIKNQHAFVIKVENAFETNEHKLPILKSKTQKTIALRARQMQIELQEQNDTLVINTLESDFNLGLNEVLIKEYAHLILKGSKLYAKAIKAKQVIFAVEEQNHETVRFLSKKIKSLKLKNIEVKLLKNKKQVKKLKTIESDLQKLINLYEAVEVGKYVTTQVVAVAGLSIKNPSYYLVTIGTPLNELIDLTGGLRHEYEEIVRFKDNAEMAVNDGIIIKQDIKEEKDLKEKEKLKKLLAEKQKEAKEKIYDQIEANRQKFMLCLFNMVFVKEGKLYSAKSITNSINLNTDAVLFLSRKEYKKTLFNFAL